MYDGHVLLEGGVQGTLAWPRVGLHDLGDGEGERAGR